MDFSLPHFIHSDGYQIATYAAGPKDGLPVILVHGWPEIAYSWSPIVPALIGAGYRVICYDLRGFGRSDAPLEDVHYAVPQLVADLEAVMTAYGYEQVCIAGHDWGASIVWHAARMIPHKVSRVIGICVPHTARAPAPPLKIIEKRFGAQHYFIEFRDRREEVAKLFARDPDGFFRLMFRSTPPEAKADETFTFIPTKFAEFLAAGSPPLKGAIMDGAARAKFVKAYARTGFAPPMNLYRNIDENWHLADGMSDRITQPVLMISPERDLLLPPELTDPMVDMVPHLTRVRIPNCGHWAMWDAPEALSQEMLNWLGKTINKVF